MRGALLRMRRYPLAVVTLLLVVMVEILALYVVFPRSESTSAVHPDSLQYICYAFQIRGFDAQTIVSATGPLLAHFGEATNTCVQYGLAEPLVWQVYPRLLLPLAIVVTTSIAGSWGALIPSITFFFVAALVWLLIVYWFPLGGRPRRLNALYVAVAVGPFLAFSAMLWPAAVLTEGPTLVLLLLLALVLATIPLNAARTSASVLLGLLLLLTRPSWPIVAVIWSATLITYFFPRFRSPLLALVQSVIIVVLSAGAAFGVSRAIEAATVAPAAREARDDLTGAIPAVGFPQLAIESMRSTTSDAIHAILRLDILSPILILLSILAIGYLLLQRNWRAFVISVAAVGFGAYSVGLFGTVIEDYNSHFRYLVPGAMFSLGAAWLQRTGTRPPVS